MDLNLDKARQPKLKQTEDFEFDDFPITNSKEDELGRLELAKIVTNYLINLPAKNNSFVVGINGSWGSGKTSFMNMMVECIANEISNRNDHTGVTYDSGKDKIDKSAIRLCLFKPWNALSEDAIISQFFDTISTSLKAKNYGDIFCTLAISLASASNVLFDTLDSLQIPGAKIAAGISKSLEKYLKNLSNPDIDSNQSLIKAKNSLYEKLSKFRGKIIVLIDDLDRCNRKEIALSMQLMKSIMDFPNIVFVLFYDKDVVAKSLFNEQAGIDGNEYLSKIVQQEFHLSLAQIQLDNLVKEKIRNKFAYEINKEETRFNTVTALLTFKSPREAKRFLINFEKDYYIFSKNIDFCDLIGISYLRCLQSLAYNRIVQESPNICVSSADYYKKSKNSGNNLLDLEKDIDKNAGKNISGLIDFLFAEETTGNETYVLAKHNRIRFFPVFLQYVSGSPGVSFSRVIFESEHVSMQSAVKLLGDSNSTAVFYNLMANQLLLSNRDKSIKILLFLSTSLYENNCDTPIYFYGLDFYNAYLLMESTIGKADFITVFKDFAKRFLVADTKAFDIVKFLVNFKWFINYERTPVEIKEPLIGIVNQTELLISNHINDYIFFSKFGDYSSYFFYNVSDELRKKINEATDIKQQIQNACFVLLKAASSSSSETFFEASRCKDIFNKFSFSQVDLLDFAKHTSNKQLQIGCIALYLGFSAKNEAVNGAAGEVYFKYKDLSDFCREANISQLFSEEDLKTYFPIKNILIY